jgi:hypothetical protein
MILAYGANFISSWIRIRIQETNLMLIRIRIRNTDSNTFFGGNDLFFRFWVSAFIGL